MHHSHAPHVTQATRSILTRTSTTSQLEGTGRRYLLRLSPCPTLTLSVNSVQSYLKN